MPNWRIECKGTAVDAALELVEWSDWQTDEAEWRSKTWNVQHKNRPLLRETQFKLNDFSDRTSENRTEELVSVYDQYWLVKTSSGLISYFLWMRDCFCVLDSISFIASKNVRLRCVLPQEVQTGSSHWVKHREIECQRRNTMAYCFLLINPSHSHSQGRRQRYDATRNHYFRFTASIIHNFELKIWVRGFQR